MSFLVVEHVSFGYSRTRQTLDDVSFSLVRGKTLGVVGESGSGKTTLLRLLLGLNRPTSGTIRLDGNLLDPRNAQFMRSYRRKVQPVFQDPYSSLDPRQTVARIVSEPLRAMRLPGDHRQIVSEALAAVGLDQGSLERYPHQFSGGQRQRIAIARAIVARPQLLVADEPVSALDLSTRVRIITLFRRLSQETTLVFVSHDLGVVAALCDHLVILRQGQIVEIGATRSILAAPEHPYTRSLLASVPRMPA
jgi:ABC-type microcin C transport system duplicated ATPase subunit YejF